MNNFYRNNDTERNFINNGVLGIKYLLDYFKTGKKDYLKIVVYNIKEIKFWLITTMFINNHDEIFEDIPNQLLNKLYNYKKIQRESTFLTYENSKYFNYGYGITALINRNGQRIKSPINDYKENFKLIRNHIAHGNYIINEEGIIEIFEGELKYLIDPKWLETITYCCLSNQNIGFRKGLTNKILLSNDKRIKQIENHEELNKIILSETLETTTITLNTGKKDKFMEIFKPVKPNITEETIDLQLITTEISDYIEVKNQKIKSENVLTSKKTISEIIKELEKIFEKAVSIEKQPISNKDIAYTEFFSRFFELDIKKQLKALADIIVMSKMPIRYNSLCSKYLFELLNYLEQYNPNEILETNIPANIEVVASYSEKFLLKTYANILASNVIQNISSYSALENEIRKKFSPHMKISFGKLEHNLKKEIEDLTKRYNNLEKYSRNLKEKQECALKIKTVKEQLESLKNDQYDYSLLAKIRNAIIHDQIDLDGETVILKGYEPIKKYRMFNPKKNEWYYKEDTKQSLNFEFRMSKEKFIDMLNSIYNTLGIEVKVNISKYQKRMLKKS